MVWMRQIGFALTVAALLGCRMEGGRRVCALWLWCCISCFWHVRGGANAFECVRLTWLRLGMADMQGVEDACYMAALLPSASAAAAQFGWG